MCLRVVCLPLGSILCVFKGEIQRLSCLFGNFKKRKWAVSHIFSYFCHQLILTVKKGNPMNKSMRTVMLLLMSLLVMSCSTLTRNADDIIDDLRDARHAQYVNVGSGLLGLGRLISPTLAEASLGINSVQLLDLSKCNGNVREKFRKCLQNLYKNRYYEEIVASQHGYDSQMVLVRRDGQYVSEIVIADASDMTDALLVINGHINLENLERIINDRSSIFNK